MLTFRKGDAEKIIDPKSNLIDVLIEDGWSCSDKAIKKTDDREALMEEAKALGLKPHHKAGVDKLKTMIEEAKDGKDGA